MEDAKYIVVVHWDMEFFIETVNKKIEEGYLPIGGVMLTGHGEWYQAMLKEDIKHE